MSSTVLKTKHIGGTQEPSQSLWRTLVANRVLLLMFLPGFLLILVFEYGAMYGVIIAFKKYNIGLGILGSPWVGLDHFRDMFSNPTSLRVIKNTLVISVLKLIWGIPAPIILALLINELANGFFKRFVQSVSYLPHFISWVIISSIVYSMLSPSNGIVNALIGLVGIDPIYFMTNRNWFRTVLVASSVWKEAGWGTILYLAALASIDPTQYEAAIMDGASRIQRMLYISLPALVPVIAIVTILSLGGILNAGFDQVFNMYNSRVYTVADIIDTFVYRTGLVGLNYSFATAVGLFKSVVGLVLVLIANTVARRASGGQYGLW